MIFGSLSMKRNTAPETPYAGYGGLFMIGRPTAGIKVNEEVALTYSAFWGCVRIISETLAMLPWRVFEQDGRRKTVAIDHPLDRVIHRRPNVEMTPFTLKEVITAHALVWGNGYAEIERSRGGDIVALWPITPDRVKPCRDGDGRLFYEVSQGGGGTTQLNPEDMFHLKGPGFDGTCGYSVVGMAREGISLGIATERFGAGFFGNGAQLGAVIEQEAGHKGLSAAAVKNMLGTFNKKNRGAGNNHQVEYLDAGLKYKPIGVPPEDAQFLETRKFQAIEMCRWFRMPPHKLAELDRSTHNNIESQGIEFVIDTMMPWVVRLEQEANLKLFGTDDRRHYTKVNMMALLRGDSKARGEFYKTMMDRGVYDIDEVRAFEDMNPLERNGDLRLVPMNMVSLDQAAQQGGTGSSQQPTGAQQAVLMDATRRLVKIECKRIAHCAKGPDFVNAAAGFYVQYLEQLDNGLGPSARLIAEAAGGDDADIGEFCQRWVAQAADLLQQAHDAGRIPATLASWESRRAEELAAALITHLIKEAS